MLWRAAVRWCSSRQFDFRFQCEEGTWLLSLLTSRLLFFVSIVLLEFGYVRILSGEFFVQLRNSQETVQYVPHPVWLLRNSQETVQHVLHPFGS